jgi:hypothetical protein
MGKSTDVVLPAAPVHDANLYLPDLRRHNRNRLPLLRRGSRMNNRNRRAICLAVILMAQLSGCTAAPSSKGVSPLRGSMLSRPDVIEATQILLQREGITASVELPDDAKMRTAISAATHTVLRDAGRGQPRAATQPSRERWLIYGHDWFVVYDDVAKDWVHFWQNTNPGQPPDEAGWQCFGHIWHWAYHRELNSWTVDAGCGVDTPGYKSYAFFAR